MKINLERPIWAAAWILAMLFGIRQCELKNKDTDEAIVQWNKTIALQDKLMSEIKLADSTMLAVAARRVADSIEFESLKTRLNASTAYWRKRAQDRRPDIVLLSDSIPVLKEFIEAQDSVIVTQDSILDVQGLHLSNQAKLYQFEIDQAAAKYMAQVEISDSWREQAVSSDKKLKKEGRKKRFWRSTAIVAGSVAVVLGLMAGK